MTERPSRLYQTCKLCNSNRLRLVYTSSQTALPIMRCSMCGLFFVGRIFSSVEQQAFYDQDDKYRRFVEAQRSVPEVVARHQEWLDQIELLFPAPVSKDLSPARLLDIGCGAGDFLAVARERRFEVYGQDISVPAARLAAEWHGIRVEVRTVEDDPRDAFFDIVTMIGLLEHVIDPKAMLQHAHRLLNSGGCLFIYTPVWGMYDVLASLAARTSYGRFTKPIDRRIHQGHLQIFPRTTLVNLLRDVGLETLACDTVCEYNLPVEKYLKSVGITQSGLQSVAAKVVKALIDRKLFFRNNMRVIARKL